MEVDSFYSDYPNLSPRCGGFSSAYSWVNLLLCTFPSHYVHESVISYLSILRLGQGYCNLRVLFAGTDPVPQ
jgi:hypothetical protein